MIQIIISESDNSKVIGLLAGAGLSFSSAPYESPSEPNPNDMTPREYFCGDGSPLTLDKICTPEEREFLLAHIELYARGKVHQSKQGAEVREVKSKEEILKELSEKTGDYGGEEHVMERVALAAMEAYKNQFIADSNERLDEVEIRRIAGDISSTMWVGGEFEKAACRGAFRQGYVTGWFKRKKYQP